MDNKSDISVDIVVETKEKDQSVKISTSLTPEISTLAFQLRKIAKMAELGARAVLHRKYADGLMRVADASAPSDLVTTIQVYVEFDSKPVTCFESEKVVLSEKDISQTKLFDFQAINKVKEIMAMNALSIFDKTAKEPVVLNGVVIAFS